MLIGVNKECIAKLVIAVVVVILYGILVVDACSNDSAIVYKNSGVRVNQS